MVSTFDAKDSAKRSEHRTEHESLFLVFRSKTPPFTSDPDPSPSSLAPNSLSG